MLIQKVPVWASDVVRSLLLTVKAVDPFTFYHCVRVGQQAEKLAYFAGVDEYQQQIAGFSGILHDIGKVAISHDILMKPGRLDRHEFEIMKGHVDRGIEIIRPLADNSSFFRSVLPGVRYHHERYDGKGYPFGLQGDRIPLSARIVSVVDALDAMTHTRPYRKALSIAEAHQELRDYSGTQFDRHLIELFFEAQPFWTEAQLAADLSKVFHKGDLVEQAIHNTAA